MGVVDGPEDLDKLVEQWSGSIANLNTRSAYAAHVRRFMRWLDREYPQDTILTVLYDHISWYRDYLRDEHYPEDDHEGKPCTSDCAGLPYRESSISPMLSAIARFLKWLTREKRRDFNPYVPDDHDSSTKEPVSQIAEEILQTWQIVKMLHVSQGKVPPDVSCSGVGLRMAAVFGLFVGAAMRASEVAGARVENLNFNQNTGSRTLRFQRKRGKWTTIELGYNLSPIVDAYVGDRKQGPLIISQRATIDRETGLRHYRGLQRDVLWEMMSNLGAATRRPDFHPHLGRDTFITLALTESVQEARVMAYVGHSDFATTRGYQNNLHLKPGAHRNFLGVDWKNQIGCLE